MNFQNDRISLSVFMPFYNEEENIREVVEKTILYLKNNPNILNFEILMIDDGSKDKTKTIGLELQKQYENTRLISHDINKGYGGALITGIKNSKFDYIFYMDGDGQFDIRELDKFIPNLNKYDAILGYRADRQDHIVRKINAKLWNILNRIVFGLKVKDIDCAFKLFRRDLLTHLPLVSNGAVISTEILIRLKYNGVKFLELPVSHFSRQKGQPTGANPKVILKAFKEIFKLYILIFKK